MPDTMDSSRQRFLVLTPQRPVRHGNGSCVRTFHVVRALSRLGEVHLVQLPRQDGARIPPDVRPHCASISENPYVPKVKKKRRNKLRGPRSLLRPWKVSNYEWLRELRRTCLGKMESEAPGMDRPDLRRWMYAQLLLSEASLGHRWFGLPSSDATLARSARELVFPLIESSSAAAGVDVIWIEHTHLLPLADPLRQRFPNAMVTVNAHNILSRLHEAHARIMPNSISRRWHRIEAAACRRMEKDGLARVDHVWCCSKEDRDHILRLAPEADVSVWPNGVDTSFFTPTREHDPSPSLLLPGSMNYFPNLDGASWFARRILPLVRERVPDCLLRIAGRRADLTCGHLADQHDRIEVLADVPDMRPLFGQAWAVIVPLRAGSGTRLKILEGLAMERPVVSTTIGAEGMIDEARRCVLLADTEREFANTIVSLLEDQAKRVSMGLEGRRLVREQYDWNRMGENALAFAGFARPTHHDRSIGAG